MTIARKERGSSGRWFIGSITNEQPREMQLPLSFLDKGKRYKAVIYRDGDKADYRTNPYPVIIEEQEVTGESTLQIAPEEDNYTHCSLLIRKQPPIYKNKCRHRGTGTAAIHAVGSPK